MSFVMPEVIVQKVIQKGIANIKADPAAFDEIFAGFLEPELINDYGQNYIDSIRDFFYNTKIPVIQAWSFNAQRIPCYSIHLATELEDESKASIGDYGGDFTGENETGTAAFSCMIDIGIHANKAGDHVLWLYYILSYILFKEKLIAERLGLKLQTWNASDYSKNHSYMAENVFTRWIRFRCITQNYWEREPFDEMDDLNANITLSRAGDDEGIEDIDLG